MKSMEEAGDGGRSAARALAGNSPPTRRAIKERGSGAGGHRREMTMTAPQSRPNLSPLLRGALSAAILRTLRSDSHAVFGRNVEGRNAEAKSDVDASAIGNSKKSRASFSFLLLAHVLFPPLQPRPPPQPHRAASAPRPSRRPRARSSRSTTPASPSTSPPTSVSARRSPSSSPSACGTRLRASRRT
jgi:hypothetical protein